MSDSNWSMRLHLLELDKVRRRPSPALFDLELEESLCSPSRRREGAQSAAPRAEPVAR